MHHIQSCKKQMVEFGEFKLIRISNDTNVTFISINKFSHCISTDTIVMKIQF
jgi:hypothetical protein